MNVGKLRTEVKWLCGVVGVLCAFLVWKHVADDEWLSAVLVVVIAVASIASAAWTLQMGPGDAR